MKDIIWKMPWDLYKDYKEVRERIKELRGYKELKEKESRLQISMAVTSIGGLTLILLIVYLAIT